MPPEPFPGSSLSLLRIADRASLPPGKLMTPHTLCAPRGTASVYERGAQLLCVGALEGRRVVAEAEFFAAQGDHDVFRLVGEWRWVESRRFPRYEAHYPATVRSRFGNGRQHGVLRNLSAGGAAIEVQARPPGRDLDLLVSGPEAVVLLPADLVKARPADTRVILHLAFQPLTATQEGHLNELLAALAG